MWSCRCFCPRFWGPALQSLLTCPRTRSPPSQAPARPPTPLPRTPNENHLCSPCNISSCLTPHLQLLIGLEPPPAAPGSPEYVSLAPLLRRHEALAASSTLFFLDGPDAGPLPELRRVGVGGTFDRLHLGHKKLLTTAAVRAQLRVWWRAPANASRGLSFTSPSPLSLSVAPPPLPLASITFMGPQLVARDTLVVGLANGDELLMGKQGAERITPFLERRDAVVAFLALIRPDLKGLEARDGGWYGVTAMQDAQHVL